MRSIGMFDTLDFMDELKRAGMGQDQAEALTKATAKAFSQLMDAKDLASKKDLQDSKLELIKSIHDGTWKTIGMVSTIQALSLGVIGVMQFFNH